MWKYDIMIIELENDIDEDEIDVEYACVAPYEAQEGVTVRISGYGSDLNHTEGEPSGYVLKTYETNITKCPYKPIEDDKICTINENYQLSCAGDSGSGVISKSADGRSQVEGIVVAGIGCEPMIDQEAELRKKPAADILTSTYYFLDWICFVSGICPREQDRQMVSKYLENETSPHPPFVLVEQI